VPLCVVRHRLCLRRESQLDAGECGQFTQVARAVEGLSRLEYRGVASRLLAQAKLCYGYSWPALCPIARGTFHVQQIDARARLERLPIHNVSSASGTSASEGELQMRSLRRASRRIWKSERLMMGAHRCVLVRTHRASRFNRSALELGPFRAADCALSMRLDQRGRRAVSSAPLACPCSHGERIGRRLSPDVGLDNRRIGEALHEWVQ
jgi:hypothetical protein